jgi:hypothetical protein
MTLVGAPRQVGKTALTLSLLKSRAGYLSRDVPEHPERILKRELPRASTWAFDERHKYARFEKPGGRSPALLRTLA